MFRSAFFLPTVMSSVAMAITWALILRLEGQVNAILGIHVPWMTNASTALLGISFLGIWQSVGWFMVAGEGMAELDAYQSAHHGHPPLTN
jgi:multiple sugar transport system permease protein